MAHLGDYGPTAKCQQLHFASTFHINVYAFMAVL